MFSLPERPVTHFMCDDGLREVETGVGGPSWSHPKEPMRARTPTQFQARLFNYLVEQNSSRCGSSVAAHGVDLSISASPGGQFDVEAPVSADVDVQVHSRRTGAGHYEPRSSDRVVRRSFIPVRVIGLGEAAQQIASSFI